MLEQRNRIYENEIRLKEEKDRNSEELMNLMKTHRYSTVSDELFGSITYVQTSRESINKDRLKQELAIAGVPVDVIVSAFKSASSSTDQEFVKYNKVNG